MVCEMYGYLTDNKNTNTERRKAMIKKIKEKLREPFFVEDLLIDYVRPTVLGLIGSAIGIVISYVAGWL